MYIYIFRERELCMCVLIYMYILFFWLVATCAIMLNVYSINIISVVFRIQSHRHSTSNRKSTCRYRYCMLFPWYSLSIYSPFTYVNTVFKPIPILLIYFIPSAHTSSSKKMNEGCLKFKIYN